MFEIFNKMNRAEQIHIFNLDRGRKPFLLTINPITPKNRAKLLRYLSINKIPYFGNVELTKQNNAHLHLTIYPEDLEQIRKLKNKFGNLRTLLEEEDREPDDRYKFHIQAQLHLELDNGYIYKDGWKYPLKDYYKSEMNELSKMRDSDNYQIPEFHSYFNRKAILKEKGFARASSFSRIPKQKIKRKDESKKLKKHLKKIEEFWRKKKNFHQFSITFENISKIEQSQITRILSTEKLPFLGSVQILNNKIFMKIDVIVNFEKIKVDDAQYPTKLTSKAFEKLKYLFGEKLKIEPNLNSKVRETVFRRLENLENRKLSKIVDEKTRLYNLGFVREIFMSRI